MKIQDLENETADEYANRIENNKIMTSARREFIKVKYRQYFSLLWRHKPDEVEKVQPMKLSELKNKIEEYSNIKRKWTKNYFITITTPPKTDKLKFINGCLKLFDIAVIDRGYMVFEQRGENVDDLGKGIHCHMLVFREKYNDSKFRTRYLNKLLKLEINDNYKSVNQLKKLANMKNSPFSFQNIKDETVPKKISYINGDKNDEKLLKCQMDILFRKKFDLQKMYTKKI